MIIYYLILKTIRVLVLSGFLLSGHAYAQDTLPPLDSDRDPSVIVNSFYDGSNTERLWSADPENKSTIHSAYLASMYAEGLRKRGQFALTFDPIVNGQDALISKLIIYPA